MSARTKKLKSLLHESIENIDDVELLQTVKDILDSKKQPAINIELTDYQKERINKAKNNIAKGEYLSNEQADEIVAQWLKK